MKNDLDDGRTNGRRIAVLLVQTDIHLNNGIVPNCIINMVPDNYLYFSKY
jgi:hypothetical protein